MLCPSDDGPGTGQIHCGHTTIAIVAVGGVIDIAWQTDTTGTRRKGSLAEWLLALSTA
jgi:hypothetical protein